MGEIGGGIWKNRMEERKNEEKGKKRGGKGEKGKNKQIQVKTEA